MRILRAFVLVLLPACGGVKGDPAPGVPGPVVNVWSSATVDVTRLPLGDVRMRRDAAERGALFVCTQQGRPGVGAHRAGPWLDLANGTWDLTKKLFVGGSTTWPAASYGESTTGTTRVIVTNGLPTKTVTGSFPIAPSDPAYAYDRNPNTIQEARLRYELPAVPEPAASPSCLPLGEIGLLRNGVVLFAPVDEVGRDAVAWETQDTCQGHPEQRGAYHYHDVSTCLRDAAKGPSTVVGFAADGFPVVVERDAEGRLPTNADLDECHGRTSDVLFDGRVVRTYHYAVTIEFPYTVGCFRGAPTRPIR